MGIEEGASSSGNTECAEGVQCLKRKAISDEVPISNGNGVVEEARCSKSEEVNDGAVISNGNCVIEETRCSKSEEVNDGAVFSNGNGASEEARCSKSEAVSDGALICNGNCVSEEARCSKSEAVSDGAVISNGNCVSEEVRHLESEAMSDEGPISNGNRVVEEAQHLESEAMSSDEAVISNGNGVAEEARCSKSDVVNDGTVLMNVNGGAEVNAVLKSDGLNNGVNVNGVTEEDGGLKSEPISNGAAISDGFDSGDGGSCGVTCLRTYKRRKYDKSSSKGKAQEDRKKCVETASHIADQVAKEPFDATLGNTADDCDHRHWGNVVLKHLHQSLGSVNGGIGEAKIDRLSHRTRTEANGYAPVMQSGSSSESHGHGGTEMCQRMLCEVLTSEMFNSLCKTIFENFQGIKPESVVDFSVVISRMQQKFYENSPELFLSDIQQVWRKLQNTSNKIFALSKSLVDLSTTCYSELVGISAQSTSEDEKQVESDAHMKPEEMEECAIYKICSCSCCRERVDGTDCLVCDSCEKVYHLSCIEPAVKEIPHKSWYCANCTTSGIGSPHENCVVCTRLNGKKTPKKIIGDESLPTNEETFDEFEENCRSYNGIKLYMGKKPNCKVCGNEFVKGEKIRICGHPYCPSQCYHVRCLTSKQINIYSFQWYCPSCLCQSCLTNQDDDRIVLCDGCDHGHHIYCMKPPLVSIPQGKWFCRKCDAGIKAISQAKKAYESNKLRTGEYISKTNANNKNNCSNICVEELESVGGMDMLLTAANCLNFEENLSET
ncbi:uncharacterized protein LOC123909384 [Trifolium pratense]|uniref:uncharacterized protein LOC123909384 n=1 Tax=Trifolium pratense TaxID=57577 RepID=UPI001E695520|nr:uncharacterized protein LOC123909384 [Trifolium pratense]